MGTQVQCRHCGVTYETPLPVSLTDHPMRCVSCGAKAAVEPRTQAQRFERVRAPLFQRAPRDR